VVPGRLAPLALIRAVSTPWSVWSFARRVGSSHPGRAALITPIYFGSSPAAQLDARAVRLIIIRGHALSRHWRFGPAGPPEAFRELNCFPTLGSWRALFDPGASCSLSLHRRGKLEMLTAVQQTKVFLAGRLFHGFFQIPVGAIVPLLVDPLCLTGLRARKISLAAVRAPGGARRRVSVAGRLGGPRTNPWPVPLLLAALIGDSQAAGAARRLIIRRPGARLSTRGGTLAVITRAWRTGRPYPPLIFQN